MCRLEERVYIDSEGRRQKFEEAFPCDKAPRGKLCSRVKRKTTEYFPKNTPVSRDNTSSPASNNPPTPTGTGSYYVESRRPSVAGGRPSTRDGQRVIKPEIIIEFGGRGDGKTKKYPSVSLSTKGYNKRSSTGASSIGSDVAVDSPGSDASYTLRTGFPDSPVPPTDALRPTESYNTRAAVPQSHHRHTSSSSSFTSSSQPPSLYVASDQDSPSSRRAPRYPATIVHNPPAGIPPPSPVSSTRAQAPSYRTQIVEPQGSSRENLASDGLFPLNYSDLVDQHSGSSRASSKAPEIIDRAGDRERRRKQKDDERKHQENVSRRAAEERVKEEEQKQVRFELGRYEAREKERAQNKYAEQEKRRAEDREDARRRAEKEREREAKAAKEVKKEKSKPPSRDYTTKRPGHSRRASMTQADIDERSRLLAETEVQMARERQATEAREREERAAYLREQQQTSEYWDPRGGERYPISNNSTSNNSSTIGRRASVSRRPSVSSGTPAPPLGRANSKRVSIIQPTPPPQINTSVQQQYSTRTANGPRQHGPPPLSYPGQGASAQNYARPSSSGHPSARRPSYSQENPFAQPPTRNSAISSENPFASPLSGQAQGTRDPWDSREMHDALPHTRQPQNDRLTLQRRGEEVINRATSSDERVREHGIGNARQATRAMGKAVGFEDDYEDSSSENDEDKLAGLGKRLGMGSKRRH